MTREWFTTYCQNAAANVLDRDGKVRFTYEQLSASLDAVSRHCVREIPSKVLNLDDNIQKLCNSKHGAPSSLGDSKHGAQLSNDNTMYALLLTMLNIHAAYLMISGLWKEEPVQTGGVDAYGFEIF